MPQIVVAATAPETEDVKTPKGMNRPTNTYTVRAAAVDATTTQDLANDLRQALINLGVIR